MIIIRLFGGLGNQMFQYAAGRRLAYHTNTDLYLDATWFLNNSLRKYDLDVFKINAAIASPDLLKCESLSFKSIIKLGGRHFSFGKTSIRVIREKAPTFQKNILLLHNNMYLDGYWQSEKYFEEIANLISEEFSFITPPSPANQELIDEIAGCNSVCVHIRRGDYISHPETRRIHFVCDVEYYKRAIEMITKQVENPSFFIFSDDLDWSKKHVVSDFPIKYISHNPPEQGHEDLRLMIQCKNHIIANSSFSWWGAWLGKKQGQIVIAPKKWYAVEKYSSKDKIPNQWQKI